MRPLAATLALLSLGAITPERAYVDFSARVEPVARLTLKRDGPFLIVDALQTGADYRHDRETHYVGEGSVLVAFGGSGVRVTGQQRPARLLAGR